MLSEKTSYERSDLLEEAEILASSAITEYELSDYSDQLKRTAHWAVNTTCNRLWVKNGGKEPDIDKDLALSILDKVKETINARCDDLIRDNEPEMER